MLPNLSGLDARPTGAFGIEEPEESEEPSDVLQRLVAELRHVETRLKQIRTELQAQVNGAHAPPSLPRLPPPLSNDVAADKLAELRTQVREVTKELDNEREQLAKLKKDYTPTKRARTAIDYDKKLLDNTEKAVQDLEAQLQKLNAEIHNLAGNAPPPPLTPPPSPPRYGLDWNAL
jgi:DNA repair exonuclease SbcCD ATPase subunit